MTPSARQSTSIKPTRTCILLPRPWKRHAMLILRIASYPTLSNDSAPSGGAPHLLLESDTHTHTHIVPENPGRTRPRPRPRPGGHARPRERERLGLADPDLRGWAAAAAPLTPHTTPHAPPLSPRGSPLFPQNVPFARLRSGMYYYVCMYVHMYVCQVWRRKKGGGPLAMQDFWEVTYFLTYCCNYWQPWKDGHFDSHGKIEVA